MTIFVVLVFSILLLCGAAIMTFVVLKYFEELEIYRNTPVDRVFWDTYWKVRSDRIREESNSIENSRYQD